MRSGVVRRLRRLPPLPTISILFYGLTGIALAIAAIWYFPGKNPRGVLAALAILAILMTCFVLARGVRFGTREATVFMGIYLAGAASMSYTTGQDMGAFSNGLVLPLLGIYAGWLLPRRSLIVFYVGLVGWLLAMVSRGDPMLIAMSCVGAAQSVVAAEVAWRLTVRISGLMYVDALTGVLNRAGLIRQADLMIERARASRTPLCLAVIDLDDLRTVNNTAGHRAGDAQLVGAVQSWAPLTEAGHLLGRIGGDEFVALLARTTEREALEQLRALRRASGVPWTFGVTEVYPGDTYDSATERADLRMYAVKGGAAVPNVPAPRPRGQVPGGPSTVTEQAPPSPRF
jgi:diguanylate cyclase (GGDEF)-like protein